MSSAAVRTAFEATLVVAYPDLPLVEIENVNVVPPKDANGRLTDFMAVLYMATEDALGIGGKCFRERGTLNVLVYVQAGRGAAAAAGIADELRNLFGGRDLPVAAPGMRLAILDASPLTSYLGRPGVPVGAFYVGMIALTYEYDFLRS